MKKITENIKERTLNNLDECLRKLCVYDSNCIMPLLYVLVAHHDGHLVSITSSDSNNIFSNQRRHILSILSTDNYQSDLLSQIRNSVNEDYFSGQPAEIVFDFYSNNNEYIGDLYSEIIEYIIEFLTVRQGRLTSMYSTPKEVSSLMVDLVSNMVPKKIYDPCAGLCSFFLSHKLDNILLFGQEINHITKIIADVRAQALLGIDSLCEAADCIEQWNRSSDCDTLLSDLPMGIRLRKDVQGEYKVNTLEDFVLSQFEHSENLQKAVLLVSMGTCFRSDNRILRESLCKHNYVDTVISLPVGIIPQSGIATAIIILNKQKIDEHVKFVCADDCLLNNSSFKKILDYKKVLCRIQQGDNTLCKGIQRMALTSFEEIASNNYKLTPTNYITENLEILPGQVVVPFTDLAERIRGERTYSDLFGKKLIPQNMSTNIVDINQDSVEENVDLNNERTHLVKITDKCVIFNMRADKFYIKTDNEPLFVTPNFSCFLVDTTKCKLEYFVYAVTNAVNFRERALTGVTIQRVDFNELSIPMYSNITSQENIIKRLYREEKNRLRAKLDELEVLSGKASDLVHNLGVTFTRISAGIGSLRSDEENETVESIYNNVKFALRQINSTGADFSMVKPSLKIEPLFESVYNYLYEWGNFGFNTFELSPIKCSIPNDTKVKIDMDLFYTMLDCIFINAHQHGFNKQYTPENKVFVELKGVIVDDEEYALISISNNGTQLPDDFTLKDFCSRGVVGINSFQDGLGGNHIYEIAHLFNGKISIDNNPEWLSFNILLPIYLSSNKSNFEDYECECL